MRILTSAFALLALTSSVVAEPATPLQVFPGSGKLTGGHSTGSTRCDGSAIDATITIGETVDEKSMPDMIFSGVFFSVRGSRRSYDVDGPGYVTFDAGSKTTGVMRFETNLDLYNGTPRTVSIKFRYFAITKLSKIRSKYSFEAIMELANEVPCFVPMAITVYTGIYTR